MGVIKGTVRHERFRSPLRASVRRHRHVRRCGPARFHAGRVQQARPGSRPFGRAGLRLRINAAGEPVLRDGGIAACGPDRHRYGDPLGASGRAAGRRLPDAQPDAAKRRRHLLDHRVPDRLEPVGL
eukprot:gene14408-16820_t